MPNGEHTITVTAEYPAGNKLPEKTFKLTINNPDYGKPMRDEDVEALKQQFAGSHVISLQQGVPVPELKLDAYAGCQDNYIQAPLFPNEASDRNMNGFNNGGA